MKSYWKKASAMLLILLGLCLAFYPWLSNWVFENRVDSVIETYENEQGERNIEEERRLFEEARNYNSQLTQVQVSLKDPFGKLPEQENVYEEMLSDILCFVEIPKINIYLPVYHGTSDPVLEKGIGHVEGSSLPVGGDGTHAILSGHTGINTAKMFTDLAEMKEGDLFFIHVLGETLAYKVCRILVITPDNTEPLKIEADRDLVTLLTCTPYGINTHRLLVTGERTEYSEGIYHEAASKAESTSSLWMDSYRKAVSMGVAASAILFIVSLPGRRRRKVVRKCVR